MAESYVRFVLAPDAGRKTQIWRVLAKRTGDQLGVIHWFGRWRQYTFSPEPDTVFSVGCMADISAFIEDEMKAWRQSRG